MWAITSLGLTKGSFQLGSLLLSVKVFGDGPNTVSESAVSSGQKKQPKDRVLGWDVPGT